MPIGFSSVLRLACSVNSAFTRSGSPCHGEIPAYTLQLAIIEKGLASGIAVMKPLQHIQSDCKRRPGSSFPSNSSNSHRLAHYPSFMALPEIAEAMCIYHEDTHNVAEGAGVASPAAA